MTDGLFDDAIDNEYSAGGSENNSVQQKSAEVMARNNKLIIRAQSQLDAIKELKAQIYTDQDSFDRFCAAAQHHIDNNPKAAKTYEEMKAAREKLLNRLYEEKQKYSSTPVRDKPTRPRKFKKSITYNASGAAYRATVPGEPVTKSSENHTTHRNKLLNKRMI